ncbi:MAG: single-stranded DNA-binding protein [Akkermansiaceae bacterium]
MASFNKVMIMGNITRDIELRATPKGTSVTDLGLACNRVRMGEDGQKIEEVTFVDVTLWGRQAELASQYLAKGSPIFIEGRLHMDSWTDQATGKQRTRLKVVGENMQFIGSPGGGNNGGGNSNGGGYNSGGQQASQPAQPAQRAPQQSSPPQGGSPASNMPDFQDEDDDIPF